ncbi:hypothetical protein [Bacillus sp. CGMCC 1.16541]|uniref:hypothetical protein n=1 Tax=Bacillus sp. CGMCC 1.16541 TaxID=2185143 RepID=UPI000D73EFA2|nr:hypothetical protein [Bacillus sp. CGMCC 1.16541]
MKEVRKLATVQRVVIPANTPTLIVTGNGNRVFLQAGVIYIGASNVDTTNGVFISGTRELLDLGHIATGETLYGYSETDNVALILTYSTVFT